MKSVLPTMTLGAVALSLALAGGSVLADAPKKSPKASDTKKKMDADKKARQPVKALPPKVKAGLEQDHHFGHDGIKAIYSVGTNLYWVEVTDGGENYVLEYDANGNLLALAMEDGHGGLLILVEDDQGNLWAVDEAGNAVPLH